ncbi:kinesin-like protein [Pycnococcus provasolii]
MAANAAGGGGDASTAASQRVAVGVRLRPMAEAEVKSDVKQCLTIAERGKGDGLIAVTAVHPETEAKLEFDFDVGFDENATQAEVFDTVGDELIDATWDGYNATLFAYGQTGSGKSHLMVGNANDHREKGIIPRAASRLFDRVKAAAGTTCRVEVSMFEIYNERCRDLFAVHQAADSNASDGATSTPKKNWHKAASATLAPTGLKVREHPKTGPYLEGLSARAVASADEALSLLDVGLSVRTVASTNMNRQSSRAHTVFQLTLAVREESSKKARRATLSLVDLAGSERAARTGAMGDRLREGSHINRSLGALGKCINALVAAARDGRDKPHIPYRDSVMTHLLRESLGGNARTSLIATLSPSERDYHETLSTLQYASRAREVRTRARVNAERLDAAAAAVVAQEAVVADAKRAQELSSEVVRLRQDLADRDAALRASEESSTVLSGKLEGQLAAAYDELAKVQASTGDWESRLEQSRALARRQKDTLRACGMNTSAETPHLVNLHEDPSLSGTLRYRLVVNGRTVIGARMPDGPGGGEEGGGGVPARVVLGGAGVFGDHCEITVVRALPGAYDAADGTGGVTATIVAIGEAPCYVNGRRVLPGAGGAAAPMLLHPGDRVMLGNYHALCYQDGRSGSRYSLPSWEDARRELVEVSGELDALLGGASASLPPSAAASPEKSSTVSASTTTPIRSTADTATDAVFSPPSEDKATYTSEARESEEEMERSRLKAEMEASERAEELKAAAEAHASIEQELEDVRQERAEVQTELEAVRARAADFEARSASAAAVAANAAAGASREALEMAQSAFEMQLVDFQQKETELEGALEEQVLAIRAMQASRRTADDMARAKERASQVSTVAKRRLESDVLRALPMVEEANALAKRLKRRRRFQLKLVRRPARGAAGHDDADSSSKLLGGACVEVATSNVAVASGSAARPASLWPLDVFEDRLEGMREMQACAAARDWAEEQAVHAHYAGDPFNDPAGFLYELGRCTLYLAPLEHGLSTSAATGKGALLPAFAPLGGTGASVAVEAHMVDEAVEVGVTRVEGVPREDGWGVVLEAHCDIPNSYATQEEGVLSLDESFPAYNGSASMNWTTRFLLSAHASLGGALADGTVTIDVFATPPPQPNEGMAMIVAPQQQHHDAEEESREAAARLEQQRASALEELEREQARIEQAAQEEAHKAAADVRAAAARLEQQRASALEELDREQARIEQAAQEEAHKAAALVEERRAAAVSELEKRRARIEQTAEEAIAVIDMHVQRRDEWLARVEAAEETARAALEQLARMEGEMKRLERLVLASSTNVVPKSRRLAPLAPRPLDGELARASSLDSDADPTPLAMPPSTSTQGRARGKYRIAPMPPPPSEHAESTVASAPNPNPSPSGAGAGAGPVPVGRKRLCVIQ